MSMLTEEERAAFLDIYAGEQDDVAFPASILESLITHGLLARASDGAINPTEQGDELYQQLTGDEPYEGI